MTLVRKGEGDGFLMLMAREKGVPVGSSGRASNFQFHFRKMHVALPSAIQDGSTQKIMKFRVAGSPQFAFSFSALFQLRRAQSQIRPASSTSPIDSAHRSRRQNRGSMLPWKGAPRESLELCP